MCGLVTGAMFRREVAKTVARGLSAWRSASNAAVTTGSLAQEACLAPLATSARGFSALTAEDKAGYDTIVAAIKKDPKSVYNKYRGRYVIQFSLSLSRSLRGPGPCLLLRPFRPLAQGSVHQKATRRRLFPLAVILRTGGPSARTRPRSSTARTPGHDGEYLTPCPRSASLRRPGGGSEDRTQMLGMVDEYRQLFKEIGKNPTSSPTGRSI